MQVFTPKQRQCITELDLEQHPGQDHSLVADQNDPVPPDDEEERQLEESWRKTRSKRHE